MSKIWTLHALKSQKKFHIFRNIMLSLPNKDKTRQNKRLNSHTPKPTRCLSLSNNTKPQESMQKTKQGVVGRGRQYLGQVVNGVNHTREIN